MEFNLLLNHHKAWTMALLRGITDTIRDCQANEGMTEDEATLLIFQLGRAIAPISLKPGAESGGGTHAN